VFILRKGLVIALSTKVSKKHPLTKEQKCSNRKLAKERVYIEHVNSKFKVFNLLENRFRSHSCFGLSVTLIVCFINAFARGLISQTTHQLTKSN